MNLNELYRLICNLARIGTVLEVDTEKYLARVETGENKTDWIRWAVPRAGEAVQPSYAGNVSSPANNRRSVYRRGQLFRRYANRVPVFS